MPLCLGISRHQPDARSWPMTVAVPSVNQTVLSGPAAMPSGELLAVGTRYSNTCPLVLMRPILSAPFSVNQSTPSGPAVMPVGVQLAVARGNSLS